MSDPAPPFELFGTDEPIPERRLLRAGTLTAILEDGNLRDIRFAGVELVRAINYLARDPSWGTYKPQLSNIEIDETEESFSVSYCGLSGDSENCLRYIMKIEGEANGLLSLEANAEALTDFSTNRTGFVILHAADVAGGPLEIRHSDGTAEKRTFPRLISADQPAFNIAAMTHEAAKGISCTVEMEGDSFEMEDQRNWADASFKTYVRPLSKPRPYVIGKGSVDRQRISIRVDVKIAAQGGQPPKEAALRLGEPVGCMPEISLFVDETVPSSTAALPGSVAQTLIVRLDPHQDEARLADAARLASDAGMAIAVEVVMDAHHARGEAQGALQLIERMGIVPTALLISPRRDFKTRPSRTVPNGEVAIEVLIRAFRDVGFDGPIGAGTPSNFTEFNRNPPPPECDFVFFGTSAIVHAADDSSVVETLDTYPMLLEAAAALCPGKAIWLGPCTIGVRHNPYGEAPTANPGRGRVPSAQDDPRHSTLFGAAYAVGIVARAASQAVERIILASPGGPFGIADLSARPFPIHRVVTELMAAAGSERLSVKTNAPGLFAVIYRNDEGIRGPVANLGNTASSIVLPEVFHSASSVERNAGVLPLAIDRHRLTLAPYRVALISDSLLERDGPKAENAYLLRAGG